MPSPAETSGFLPLLILTLTATLAVMLGLWVLSLRLRNAAIVDSYWGPGFLVISILAAVSSANLTARAVLLLILVAVWSLRLGVYLTWRNLGKGEDYRYAAMREHHGEAFGRVSLITVFGLQGLLMWIISLPLQIAIVSPAPGQLTLLDALGALFWLVGMGFETIGDAQLARFLADPANRGRVMDRGLWAYTRHPNYFGEAMIWWGYGLLALSVAGGGWTLIGPALMTFLLVKISGAALLERGLHERRRGYADYVSRTSAFIPRPPQRHTGSSD